MHKSPQRIISIVLAALVSFGCVGSASANIVVSWNRQTIAGFHDWVGISASTDGKKVVAIDYGARIWTSVDGGVKWTERTSVGVNNWTAVVASADGTRIVAAAEDGTYVYSGDSGASWTVGETPFPIGVNCLAGSSDGANLVAVLGGKSSVWTSTDSGVTWSESGSGSKNFQCASSSADGQTLVATIMDSGVTVSTDGGATWIPYFYAQKHSWAGASGISCSDDCSSIVAVEQLGSIYQSTDSGVNWVKLADAGTGFNGVVSSGDGKILMAYEVNDNQENGYGRIHLSSDAGKTWNKQTSLAQLTWPALGLARDGRSFFAMDAIGNVFSSFQIFAPTVPKIKAAVAISAGKAVITWPRPAVSVTRPVIRYEYRLGKTSKKWISIKLATTIRLTKLKKGKTYVVFVRSVNVVGASPAVSVTFKQKK